jgi:hypothetical protein
LGFQDCRIPMTMGGTVMLMLRSDWIGQLQTLRGGMLLVMHDYIIWFHQDLITAHYFWK